MNNEELYKDDIKVAEFLERFEDGKLTKEEKKQLEKLEELNTLIKNAK